MADEKTPTLLASLRGIDQLPAVRQVGLIVALAATVALAVAIVLWSREPNYQVLFGNLTDAQTLEVIEALNGLGLEYRIDNASGAVLVAATDVHNARIRLAGQGLPAGAAPLGYEILDRDPGMATSRRLEDAQHRRALEGELSRSVATIRNVQSARVHLALARQSAFVRDEAQATASVLVNLFQGQGLAQNDIDGIVHLVASSVPGLTPERVTVVDQTGQLLSENNEDPDLKETDRRFAYTRRLERTLSDRIADMLTPIVGREGIRAHVMADLDFTRVEQTDEIYDPSKGSMISETLDESQDTAGSAGGIPGSLANQPPTGGQFDDLSETTDPQVVKTTRHTLRNFELDKTVSHTVQATGEIRRLSVAVVVDHIRTVDEEGTVQRTARSAEEMQNLTSLVREAVGFVEARGDTVQVINQSFMEPDANLDPQGVPIWEQPWLWQILKQVVGPLMVFLLIMMLFRPTLKSLSSLAAISAENASAPALPAAAGAGAAAGAPGLEATMAPPIPQISLDDAIGEARTIVSEDPARAAAVIKDWVNDG